MATINYQRWDVFTDTALSGNPLAVVPDSGNISTRTMQQIANEFALPETAFVSPPVNAASGFRLRIFTPAKELPMAGHPTIGTCFALAHSPMLPANTPELTVDLGIGPTELELEWQSNSLKTVWMAQHIAEFGAVCDNRAALARALSLEPTALAPPDLPAQLLSAGVQLLYIPLRSRAEVDAAELQRDEVKRICAALNVPECPVYLFSIEPGAETLVTYSRMFAPVFGIPEDPATGGASGPLGAYLRHYRPHAVPKDRRLTNIQGVHMGRPSRIVIALPAENRAQAPIKVGGGAVFVGEGRMSL